MTDVAPAMQILAHTGPQAPPQGALVVLLNPAGGTVAARGVEALLQDLAATFAEEGVAVAVNILPAAEIAEAARRHLSNPHPAGSPPTLIAAGGDGTVSTVANVLAGSDVPLGILPLGTLNHFARDLGIPLDLAGAVRTIVRGRPISVDVGEANGRIFVNNLSIGLYPEMVRDRERLRRHGVPYKLLTMAIAVLHVLRRPPVRRLVIEHDGQREECAAPLVFVGNNTYGTALFRLARRDSLTGGVLDLTTLDRTDFFGVLRLLLRAAFGRLDEAEDFHRRSVKAVTIRRGRRRHRRLRVALDGELAHLRSPLACRSRPRALRVLVPESPP